MLTFDERGRRRQPGRGRRATATRSRTISQPVRSDDSLTLTVDDPRADAGRARATSPGRSAEPTGEAGASGSFSFADPEPRRSSTTASTVPGDHGRRRPTPTTARHRRGDDDGPRRLGGLRRRDVARPGAVDARPGRAVRLARAHRRRLAGGARVHPRRALPALGVAPRRSSAPLLYVVALSAAVKGESLGNGLNPSAWLDLLDAGWAGRAAIARLVLVVACVLGRAAARSGSSTRRPSCRRSAIPTLAVVTLGLVPDRRRPGHPRRRSPASPTPWRWRSGSAASCCSPGSCSPGPARRTSCTPCAASAGSPARRSSSPSSAGSSSCTASTAARCSASPRPGAAAQDGARGGDAVRRPHRPPGRAGPARPGQRPVRRRRPTGCAGRSAPRPRIGVVVHRAQRLAAVAHAGQGARRATTSTTPSRRRSSTRAPASTSTVSLDPGRGRAQPAARRGARAGDRPRPGLTVTFVPPDGSDARGDRPDGPADRRRHRRLGPTTTCRSTSPGAWTMQVSGDDPDRQPHRGDDRRSIVRNADGSLPTSDIGSLPSAPAVTAATTTTTTPRRPSTGAVERRVLSLRNRPARRDPNDERRERLRPGATRSSNGTGSATSSCRSGSSPASRSGRQRTNDDAVAEAPLLQLAERHLGDPLDADRHPRQVLAGVPAARRPRLAGLVGVLPLGPVPPRVVVDGVVGQRLQLGEQLGAELDA